MTLFGLEFHSPVFLLLALLPVPLALIDWRRERRTGSSLPLPGLGGAGLPKPSRRVLFRHAPLFLSVAALVCASVALARPQKGLGREDRSTEGIDIVVALDVSGSMAAEDFQPQNRLTVAKTVVGDFFRRRSRDRVGLVVFAGAAITQTPATTDQSLLLRQLDQVKLGMLPDGTAIGAGLSSALSRLKKSVAKSKLVVLVTDGVNTEPDLDPETVADIAAAMEVRVYTVGVGKGDVVPVTVRTQDPFTGQIRAQRARMEVPIDIELLKRIAGRTKGEFFAAGDERAFEDVFRRIDALETSRLLSTATRRYEERYAPWVTSALGLLGGAAALWAFGLRVVPE
jgi:Ca-activated chloride channel family protein